MCRGQGLLEPRAWHGREGATGFLRPLEDAYNTEKPQNELVCEAACVNSTLVSWKVACLTQTPSCWLACALFHAQGNDAAFNFLETVLDQVVQQFPCSDIHIGGDEVPKAANHIHTYWI